MINHARTLLLNRDSASFPGYQFPGEQVVPTNYRAINLPSYLNRLRERLFGSDPDRAMLNYRLHQYMTLLHASQYVGYVTDLDPRITYLNPNRRDLFVDDLFTPVPNHIAGGGATVYLQGSPNSPDAAGRLFNQHELEIIDPTTIRVTSFAPTRTTTDTTVSLVEVDDDLFLTLTDSDWLLLGDDWYLSTEDGNSITYSGGLSSRVDIGNSGYGVLIDKDTPGTKLSFEFYNRPKWSLGEIAATLESIGEPTLLQLFGLTQDEPYNTCRSLWSDNDDTPDRLAGILLAVIYRTEEVRTSG